MTDTAIGRAETAGSLPAHPLDPASAGEFLAGRQILADAGLLGETVRFAYYGLDEPPRTTCWRGRRAAAGPAAAGLPDRRGHRASPATSWSR